jgi:pimeloyl-ACP methyl ester carboxylesterase
VIASGMVDAPPLVLLHAVMTTATVWRPNVLTLSQHFRVYAVDVIGQGGYSVATRKIRKRQDYVGWMNQLFDGLDIPKALIVGNSLGFSPSSKPGAGSGRTYHRDQPAGRVRLAPVASWTVSAPHAHLNDSSINRGKAQKEDHR